MECTIHQITEQTYSGAGGKQLFKENVILFLFSDPEYEGHYYPAESPPLYLRPNKARKILTVFHSEWKDFAQVEGADMSASQLEYSFDDAPAEGILQEGQNKGFNVIYTAVKEVD